MGHEDKLVKNLLKLLDRYETRLTKRDEDKAESIEGWLKRLTTDPIPLEGETRDHANAHLPTFIAKASAQRGEIARVITVINQLRESLRLELEPKKVMYPDGSVKLRSGETVEIG